MFRVAALLACLAMTAAVPATAAAEAPPAQMERDARAVLLAGLPGLRVDAATKRHLDRGGRGLILFTSNLASPAQVRALTAAASCAAAAPLLVAVDQEAGPVARLRRIGIEAPPVTSSVAELASAIERMARQMRTLGINTDLAPVVDVAARPRGALRGRVVGGDPGQVAAAGSAFVAALHASRIVAVPKHFPGHGRAAADPHHTVARIGATRSALAEVDGVPFAAAVAAGARAVMVGHPVYEALDPDRPASLSPAVLGMLRDQFAFDGVAITDGLSMAGVRRGRSLATVAVAALEAGEDLLIVEGGGQVEAVVAGIVASVESGALPRERLAEAAGRVRGLASWAAPVRCRERRVPIGALRPEVR